MIYYREHRGTLEDSLATSKDFTSLIDLHNETKFSKINYYGYDERCKQDLFMVFNEHNQPIGYIYE